MRYLYFASVLLISLASTTSYGQSLRSYEKAAEKAFADHDYFNAAYFYEIVVKSKKKPETLYQYAEASRLSYSYGKAATAYAEVFRSEERALYPLLDFHYATSLKHLARYDEAADVYKRFIKEYKGTDFTRSKAEQDLKSCVAAKILQDKPNDSIVITRLGDNINTAYSDFAPLERGTMFYYSSLRFMKEETTDDKKPKKTEEAPKRLIARILKSSIEAQYGEPIDELNDAQEHSANLTWSKDGSRIFFTRCKGQRTDSIRCNIWTARWNDTTQKFVEIKPLPIIINTTNATNTHPHMTYMEDTRQHLLLFASDRHGGQGKLDIWAVEWKGEDTWGVPFNLGRTINTPDDDATPFFHNNSNTLYFSSAWHLGMGGFDIFRAKRIGNTVWQNVENLGLPFNSAGNDLHFAVNANDTSGYFASNRSGSMTLAGESCCNDIYRYSYKVGFAPPIVKVDTPSIAIVPNITPSTPSVTTTVPSTSVTTTVPSTKVDTTSIVNNTPKTTVTTPSVTTTIPSTSVTTTVPSTKVDTTSIVNNTPKTTVTTPSVTTTVPSTTTTTVPSTKVDTTSIASNTPKITVTTPSVTTTVPSTTTTVPSTTTNKQDSTKLVTNTTTPKVTTTTPSTVTSTTPSINTTTPEITEKLITLNKMLPLTLYFHNDEPDSNTTSRTTDKAYDIPYHDYIGLKDVYKKQHSQQFAPEAQVLAIKKVDDFFELDVKGEYNRMNLFFDKVLELLDAGVKLEISIKGYTSPRSTEQYNKHLAQRRITSVRKQLFIYKNGAFMKHFQRGNFSVYEVPLGEDKSPKNISDDLKDPTNSIYSVEASRERRAEIIVIQKK